MGMMIQSGRFATAAEAPAVLSATVDATGLVLTIVFSEAVNGHTGFTLHADSSVATTYASGDGTDTEVFDLDRAITDVEVLTLDYAAGDVESDDDATALANFTGAAVTNDSTVGGAFSPDDIAGLKLWVEARLQVGYGNNDPVTVAADNSGGDFDLDEIGGGGPIFKTAILNGKPIFRFAGSEYIARGVATPVVNQPLTVFLVVRVTGGASYRIAMDARDGGLHYLGIIGANRGVYAGSAEVAAGAGTTDWEIWTVKLDGASSDFRVNGSSTGSGNPGTGGYPGIFLGQAQNGGSKWVGDIAAVLLYDSALGSTDRDAVETYLNDLYAVY